MNFFTFLISDFWGILIICVLSFAVLLLLSAVFYRQFFKRFYDIVFSILALVCLSPLFIVVSILIRLKLGSPVLFKQKRVGKDNNEFMLAKFRTMTEKRDANGVYLSDEERTTRLGHFLRASSIDELPELLNILCNKMSIVGPRPLPVRYKKRYTQQQLKRHNALPGLICLDVIEGRNLLSWEKKFELDVWYVEHISLWLDIKILFMTVAVVFSKKGSVSQDGSSRGEFWGTAVEGVIDEGETDYIKVKNTSNL